MASRRPVFYDCGNCPSYCCTYPRICVTAADLLRLARRFDLDLETARRRFTKPGQKPGEVVLRHVRDALFGTACRFLDLTTRRCTVYEVRPRVCRRHPSTPTCHYYAFLMAERRHQHDPRHVTRAYNIPGEW